MCVIVKLNMRCQGLFLDLFQRLQSSASNGRLITMKWTDPQEYWRATTAHMIGGLLLVLLLSPLLVRLPLPLYNVILAPLSAGLTRETYQFIAISERDDQTFPKALQNIAEWVFGGLFATTFIYLTLMGKK